MSFSIYGFLIGIAAAVEVISLDSHNSRKGKTLKIIDYLVLIFSTLFFSRLVFILHNLQEIHDGTVIWWNISDGGLALYGALTGILLSLFFVSKTRKIPFFVLTDGIFKNMPIVQSVGRLGNYFNNELYGKPSSLPWSIYIPYEKRLPVYEQYSTFHPAFLYESILNILSWIILKNISGRKRVKDGTITCIYFINYGIIRLLMNAVRIDQEYFMGIESSTLASAAAISLGILVLILISPEKVRNSIAKYFSSIFNGYITEVFPVIYAVSISSVPLIYKVVVSAFSAVMPISVFFVLRMAGIVTDFDMTDRKERPLYCIFTTIFLLILYLATLELGDHTLSVVTLNALAISSVFTVVTFFWKISGHMTFLTMTFCSLVYLIPSPLVFLFFPVIPFVAWSRVELKKHTVPQVILGTLSAMIISILMFTFA